MTRTTIESSKNLSPLLPQFATAKEPQIDVAPAVCPLGNEYPVAWWIAQGTGWILLSNTQGRWIQAVTLRAMFMT